MNFEEKYLIYKPTKPDVEGDFSFSPSQFAKFIDKPWEFYRNVIQKLDVFEGNTASYIGTIVHGIAAAVANGEEVDKEAIERYVDSKEPSEDYDPDVVRSCYPEMAERLVNDYVLQSTPLGVEGRAAASVVKGYSVNGSYDRLEGTREDCCLVDYKTYSSSTKPKAIPKHYKYQLLCYAFALRKMGYNVTRIRLVYVNRPIVGAMSPKTGKQFKSYPSEVTVLTEVLTEEDLTYIESMLTLAVDSLEAAKKYPELLHCIFHDNRLKEK